MVESPVIIRDPERPLSQDFEALRREGLKYIQQMGSGLWTDYNTHDPGITLLELLCYGITDLGYRTDHNIVDLLTRDVDGVPTAAGLYHTAREILTSGPITFHDLRKLIVDIPGVRHAWVQKHLDAIYCIDEQNKVLQPCPGGTDQITLNGLYDVFVEYEDSVAPLSVGLTKIGGHPGKYEDPEIGRIRFRVHRDLLIKEVSVYADQPGEVVITLLDADGNNFCEPVSTYIEHAKVRTPVPVNFFVYPPEDLKKTDFYMVATGSHVRLHSTIKADYPFRLGRYIRLLPDFERKATQNNYYYFYNWLIDFPEVNTKTGVDTYQTTGRVGEIERSGAQGGYEPVQGRGILFDVESEDPVTINGVYVYGKDVGEVDVAILDDQDKEIHRVTVDIFEPGAKTWVPLHCALDPCEDYKMVAYSDRTELFVAYKASFPYELSDALVLLGGGDEKSLKQSYYFFYDWEVTYQQKIGLPATNLPYAKTDVVQAIQDRLLACRNLGEDLVCIKELEDEEVGICAEIKVKPEADVEEILAEIYHKMEEHVKPAIKFYTIDELRAEPKNKTIDQIFEGPALNHGFIDDEEFREIKKDKPLRASDIIQLIMDIDGVLSVNNFFIQSYVNEVLRIQEEWVWCPDENPCLIADFSPERSRVSFTKNGLPVLADTGKTQRLLNDRRMLEMKMRHRDHEQDLPIPVGEDMKLDDYFPVQNDLPLNYYVGQYRVPESASIDRKAKARQLKGYLLFFEQLFANYLAQLAHVPELLSWLAESSESGAEITQSYFTQPLNGEEIADLHELYLDYPSLAADLQLIIEDKVEAENRKAALLNHLLARFGESFADYSLHMYWLNEQEESVKNRLIQDQQRFLQDYPRASRDRGQGYDYRFPGERENLAGVQRRVYRKLGFKEVFRQNIAHHHICVVPAEDGWCFVIEDEGCDEPVFKSIVCPSKAAVEGMLDFLLANFPGKGRVQYKFEPCDDGYDLLRYCEKSDDEGERLGISPTDAYAKRTTELLTAAGAAEGFHFIEHILLRPRGTDTFMDIQLPGDCLGDGTDKDCSQIEVRDPYSFRASVILPAWSKRFYDLTFRRFVEDTIRMETPAHFHLRICWIGHEPMKSFEDCLCKWEESLAEREIDCQEMEMPDDDAVNNYQALLRVLIKKLYSLEQVYPAARLYDCEDPDSRSPNVILGNTNLAPFA